jgi:hypothetical protein
MKVSLAFKVKLLGMDRFGRVMSLPAFFLGAIVYIFGFEAVSFGPVGTGACDAALDASIAGV